MRTVTGNISAILGRPYASKGVVFQMVDRYGVPITLMGSDFILSNISVTTSVDGCISIELYESEQDNVDSYYLITFDDGVAPLKAYIPIGDGSIDLGECLNAWKSKKLEAYLKRIDGDIIVDGAFLQRILDSFDDGFLNEYDKDIKDYWYRYVDQNDLTGSVVVIDGYEALDKALGTTIEQIIAEMNK